MTPSHMTIQTNTKATKVTEVATQGRGVRWRSVTKEFLCVVLSSLQIGFPAMLVMDSLRAQITPSSGQQTHVVEAANGSPVININPANGNGLSHNQYDEFTVGANGVVLNNSSENSPTQVAGWVKGNPNLGNNHASLILNEVTGATDTHLNGAVEVAGNRADVVIANPNGITCNGCGFINSSHVQLTTGKPQVNDGQLAGYDVQQGQISVQGEGLMAGGVDQVDLISRSLQVNAGIWGKEINVITGNNQVSADLSSVKARQGSSGKPTVAIDVSALGGMYGNSIHLIGTEQGVGVNSAGHLQAVTGDIQIDAQGNLTFASGAKSESNGQVKLNTHGQGSIHQAANAKIMGVKGIDLRANHLNNQGQILSGGDGQLVIAQNTINSGKIISSGNLRLHAQQLDNQDGQIVASGGDLQLNIQGLTTNQNGTLQAKDNLTLNTQGYQGEKGKLIAQGGQLSLNANRGSINNQGGLIYSGGKLKLGTQGAINNSLGGRIFSKSDLQLTGLRLNNHQGFVSSSGAGTFNLHATSANALDNHQGTISTTQSLAINSQGGVDNRQGLIASHGQVAIRADRLNNQQGRISSVKSGIDIKTQQALNNHSGLIQASNSATLVSSGLSNHSGTISAQQINLQQSGYDIDNRHGRLLSKGQLIIDARHLNNQQGLINSGGGATINLSGNLDNQSTSITNHTGLYSQGNLTLNAQQLNNQHGQLQGVGNTQLIIASDINNQHGIISGASSSNLTIQTQQLNNQQGVLQAPELTLNASTLVDNQGGQITGLSTLTLTSAQINNASLVNGSQQLTSTISGANVNLSTDQLNNQRGLVYASQSLNLQGQAAPRRLRLNNQQGTLSSNGQLNLQAQSLSGKGNVFAKEYLSADLQQWDGQGNLTSQGALSLTTHSDLILKGQVAANDSANINTQDHRLTNKGYIAAGQTLTLSGGHLDTQAGSTLTASNLQLNISGGVSNAGVIQGGNALVLNANQLINQSGGVIASGGLTQLAIQQDLVNHGLINGVKTYLQANRLFNTERIYGSHIAIKANRLVNGKDNTAALSGYDGGNTSAGVIASRGDLDLAVDNILNEEEALIYAQGNFRVGNALDSRYHATGTATSLVNASADIDIQGSAYLGANEVRNENRHFEMEQVEVSHSDPQIRYIINGREYETDEVLFVETENKTSDTDLGGEWACRGKTSNSGDDYFSCSRYVYHGPYEKNKLPSWLANRHKRGGAAYAIMLAKDKPKNPAQTILTGGYLKPLASTRTFRFTSRERVVYQDTVTATAPGRIQVGGNLLFSDQLTNDKSQVVVGGSIGSVSGQSLTNIGVNAQQIVKFENAYAVNTQWKHRIGRDRRIYQQVSLDLPDIVSSISLPVAQIQSHTSTQIDAPVIAHTGTATIALVSDPKPDLSSTVSIPVYNSANPDKPIVIRTSEPDTRLPNNALYNTNAAAPNGYLIETDPQFTNHHQWLGSDYMLDALGVDPEYRWRRLGDGFYEQQLINKQILAGTGRRFIGRYTNNEDQYKGLMDAGIAFAKKFGVNVGTELTAEQMKQLTTDIVLMVKKRVTLPDGSQQTVLAPKVYLRVNQSQITGDGTLVSADRINLNLSGNVNNSGTLYGAEQLTLRANNINNQNLGRMLGDQVYLSAEDELNNIGGVINGSTVTLTANTINIGSTISESKGANGSRVGIDQIGVVGAEGNLTMISEQDMTLTGANISGEDVYLQSSSGDINLNTIELSQSEQVDFGNRNNHSNASTLEVGTTVRSGKGGTTLYSQSGDITATAGALISEGDVNLQAEGDIKLNAGRRTSESNYEAYEKQRGLLSSRSTHVIDNRNSDEAVVTQVRAANINMHASNTLTLEGTGVRATGTRVPIKGSTQSLTIGGSINLSGNKGVVINTAENHYSTHSENHERFSGIKGQGGSIFVGRQKGGNTHDTEALVHTRANLQANANITIQSQDGTVHTRGVIANSNGSINIRGVNIRDEAVYNAYTDSSTQYSESTGFTISMGGGAARAMQGIQSAVGNARDDSKSDELQEAYLIQAGLTGGQLAYDYIKNPSTLAPTLGISFGHNESESEREQITLNAQSSQFSAAQGTVSFTATGQLNDKGQRAPGSQGGNIHLTGTQVSADSIVLDANNDIILDAATNRTRTTSSNSSSGWGAGVNIGVTPNGVGITGVNVNASQSEGNSQGSATGYQGTNLLGNNISISSGGDTHIVGSTVRGNHVRGNIGGELTITSLQDTSTYHSTQESSGINISVSTPKGGVPISGSFGANNSEGVVNGDRASVVNQAGIYGGEGGIDITVGSTTTLTGGVLSSDAPKGSNTFTTGGLVHSDINNHAQWEANQSGQSINVGFGGDAPARPGIQFLGNAAANATPGMEDGYSATGVSHATITENIDVTITHPSADGVDPLEGINRDKDQINTGNVEQDVEGMIESLELMEVQQQNAAAFSELGASVVGDLGRNKDLNLSDAQITILHGLVGALAAELGGGDAASGATAAMLNKLLIRYLDDNLSGLNSKEREIILKAFSQILGTAIGAASGNDNNATLNNIINSNLTEFNHLTEDNLNAVQAELEGCAQTQDPAKKKACFDNASSKLFALSHKNFAEAFAECGDDGDCLAKAYQDALKGLRKMDNLVSSLDAAFLSNGLRDMLGPLERLQLSDMKEFKDYATILIGSKLWEQCRNQIGHAANQCDVTVRRALVKAGLERELIPKIEFLQRIKAAGFDTCDSWAESDNRWIIAGASGVYGAIQIFVPENGVDAVIAALGLTPVARAGAKGTYYMANSGATYVRTQSGKLLRVGRVGEEADMIRDLENALPGTEVGKPRFGGSQHNPSRPNNPADDLDTPNNNPVDNIETPNCTGKGCGIAGGECFVKGTPVLTPEGLKPIEQIQVGDLVMSQDEVNKVSVAKPVVQLIRNHNKLIYSLTLEDEDHQLETLGTTEEHPFYVTGKGWVAVIDLSVGDQIERHDDGSGRVGFLQVKAIELEDERQDTYNFEVAETHTYFVGKLRAWVHNQCSVEDLIGASRPGNPTKGKTDLYVKDGGFDQAIKDFYQLNLEGIKHIETPRGNLITGKLPDGRTVVVREFSSDGRPTLEIRRSNGRGEEIRYD